ncbi:MAG: hypothetical protein K6A36_05845 [Paludibacteraceae bacterium]|nr:hypothetical protein [Paludibacteraceae bacterium]
MRQILLTIVLIAVAIVLLCVGIILRKDHSFRSQHISANRRMKQDGISCATSQDRMAQRPNNKKLNIKKL